MNSITIHSFGYYEKYIQSTFIKNHTGIDLSLSTWKLTDRLGISIDLDHKFIHYSAEIKSNIKSIINLKIAIHNPLWFKINVIDQAINDYVGIGFLNMETSWLEFILNYLDSDRADQSGDTIFILFDIEFKWAISFTLSQDNSTIYIEHYA